MSNYLSIDWFAESSYTFRWGVRTTQCKTIELETNPHYTDICFNEKVGWKAQTIFGPPDESGTGHPGLHYIYSDRFYDYDKSNAAWKAADESKAPEGSALYFEAYLSAYFGKEIELVHMLAGVNCSNGYSYWVAGYREKKRPKKGNGNRHEAMAR